MKTHTNTFKTNLIMFGKQIDAKITYTLNNEQIVLTNEELNSIQPITQGDLLKSIMKELYIDSNVEIPINTEIQFEFGLFNYNNDEYEYVNFGKYYVTKSEYQEDTRSYLITCYDKMINSMVDYEEVAMIYPTTVRSYINELCETIGLDFANASDTFANYDKEVPTDLYKDLGYTYRGVLDELAQVTASNICINANNELEIRYITDTNETFDEEYFSEDNVKFGKKIGKINSIVLSRSAESDNVYLRDEQSVAQNGLYEIKIIDNQIMNFNNRSEFLPDILQRLDNLEFYSMDVKSTGICYLDICDRYTISVNNNSYTCVLMNDEINVNQGLEENIYVEEPKVSETEYKYADETDRKINQTYIIVNKQQGQIDAVVSQVNEIEQDIQNPTSTKENKYFDLEDALDSPLIDFSLYGNTSQSGTPTPDSPQPIHNVSGDNTIEICGKNLFDKDNVTTGYLTYLGGVDTASNWRITDYIKITPNTSYIMSGCVIGTGVNPSRCYYDINKTFISGVKHKTSSTTFVDTSPNNAYYMRESIKKGDLNTAMIEKSSTATTYEAYTGNSQLISLGVDNLLPNNATSQTINAIDFTKNNDGSIYANGTASAITDLYLIGDRLNYGDLGLMAGTYTLSGCVSGGSKTTYMLLFVVQHSDTTTTTYADYGDSTTIQVQSGDKFRIFIRVANRKSVDGTFYPQLEKGSKKNSYTPYGTTPIELYKISTYQDYIYKDNDRWFLHKEIGKVVLDGSESGWTKSSQSGLFGAYINNFIYSISSETTINCISTHLVGNSYRNRYNLINGISLRTNTLMLVFEENEFSTLDDFKTWLSTHNTIVYYVLNEPTDTEITDTTLLEQLNNLMTLPLYKNMTHITLTPNDLQPTMKIEYYRDTSINNNYLPREEITKYYTKTETNSQIQINSTSIQQSVAEIQTTLNSNNEAINSITNQVQTLQSSTSLQINAINTQLENGVEKLTNSLVRIDTNGINTSKTGETFNTQITNRTFEVRNSTDANVPALVFVGYDTNENRTVARIPELESRQATIGVHRTETIYEDNMYWTAEFYIGGGN